MLLTSDRRCQCKDGITAWFGEDFWGCISAEPAELVLWPPSSPAACGDVHFLGTLRPGTKKAVLPGSAGSPRGGLS